jgi:hypothetical protein
LDASHQVPHDAKVEAVVHKLKHLLEDVVGAVQLAQYGECVFVVGSEQRCLQERDKGNINEFTKSPDVLRKIELIKVGSICKHHPCKRSEGV